MFFAGGEMLFLGGEEYVSIMLCGCGLSAGASQLLGGKGLGGDPDETEKLSFFHNLPSCTATEHDSQFQ